MKDLSAGRFAVDQYDITNGDKIVLAQTHRNGSAEVVGSIILYDDEIEDALYLLNRAKARRDREERKRERDRS